MLSKKANQSNSVREQYPDEVRRIKDAFDLHAVAKSRGWVAFRLADGSSPDNTCYDTWSDAVRSTGWDRDRFMYCELQPDGTTYREAEALLKYARTLHDMGYRIPAPDAEQFSLASLMPANAWDRQRMARQLVSGKPLPEQTNDPRDFPAAYRTK